MIEPLNYNNHPQFKNRLMSLSYPKNLAEQFNKYYLKISKQPQEVNCNSYKKCENLIDLIYAFFIKQVSTNRQKLFLQELRTNSIRVLKNELTYFHKRKNRPSKESKEYTNSLNNQNFFIDMLDSHIVQEINQIIEKNILPGFRNNLAKGKFKREDLSTNDNSKIRQIIKIINKEFFQKGILQAVSNYMGCTYKVTGCAVELSMAGTNWWKNYYPQLTKEPYTRYFHIDEAIEIPKAIVYLTDVAQGNGESSVAPGITDEMLLSPIQYLTGRVIGFVGRDPQSLLYKYYNHKYHLTFGCPVFRQDFMMLPKEMQFDSHFGFDVIPDSSLEEKIRQKEQKITGPPGTFFVFSGGNILHRGGLIEEGERIVLQLCFSEAMPIIYRIKNKIYRTIKNKFKLGK